MGVSDARTQQGDRPGGRAGEFDGRSAMTQAGELLDEARGWLHKYADHFEELKARASEFGAAIPTDEPLDATHPAPAMPERFTVIGADGSAIPPDRHSAALYYLINTASLTYRHGSGQQPIAASVPDLRYSTEDLYEGRLLVQGNLLDVRRDTAEIARLADAAEAEAEPRDVPLVALTDGTLLLWVLEESPEEQRRKKVADYVSTPGSPEASRRSARRVHQPAALPRRAAIGLAGAIGRGRIQRKPWKTILSWAWPTAACLIFSRRASVSACFVSPSPVNKSYAEVEHQHRLFLRQRRRRKPDRDCARRNAGMGVRSPPSCWIACTAQSWPSVGW